MAAHQAPPSLGFSRQEHWSGLPFPFPGDLPNPEMEAGSPELQQAFYPLNHSDQIRSGQSLSRVRLLATPWTAACQAPPSMVFSRQEYWSGLPLPSPQHSEFIQTHVHSADDAIQPFHPLSSPSPPAFNLSQHQVFSKESVLRIRWPKYWSFRFSSR